MHGSRKCVVIRAGWIPILFKINSLNSHSKLHENMHPTPSWLTKYDLNPTVKKWIHTWVVWCDNEMNHLLCYNVYSNDKEKNPVCNHAKMRFFTNKSVFFKKKINKTTVGNWRHFNNDELNAVNLTIHAIIKGTEMKIIYVVAPE